MTVECVACQWFDLRGSDLARQGFGHCGARATEQHHLQAGQPSKATTFSAVFLRECIRHEPAASHVTAQRRAWLEKQSTKKKP